MNPKNVNSNGILDSKSVIIFNDVRKYLAFVKIYMTEHSALADELIRTVYNFHFLKKMNLYFRIAEINMYVNAIL
jgi:hypothetical protein